LARVWLSKSLWKMKVIGFLAAVRKGHSDSFLYLQMSAGTFFILANGAALLC
jgi:hypothetical protein